MCSLQVTRNQKNLPGFRFQSRKDFNDQKRYAEAHERKRHNIILRAYVSATLMLSANKALVWLDTHAFRHEKYTEVTNVLLVSC